MCWHSARTSCFLTLFPTSVDYQSEQRSFCSGVEMRFARLAGNGGLFAGNGDSHLRARVRGDAKLAGDGGVVSLQVRTQLF